MPNNLKFTNTPFGTHLMSKDNPLFIFSDAYNDELRAKISNLTNMTDTLVEQQRLTQLRQTQTTEHDDELGEEIKELTETLSKEQRLIQQLQTQVQQLQTQIAGGKG